MNKVALLLLICLITNACSKLSGDQDWTLELVGNDLVIKSQKLEKEVVFQPHFQVYMQPENPKMALRPGNIENVSYNVVSWENPQLEEKDRLVERKRDEAQYGDGFDNRVLDAKTSFRTADVFKAAPKIEIVPYTSRREGATIYFEFKEEAGFYFSAKVSLDPADAFPVLSFELKPKVAAYFSVAYVGAPEYPLDQLDAIWQPMLWQEKRFPHQPFLTMAYRCPLPTTLSCPSGYCVGVIVNPDEYPFEPLPLAKNSRFGVAIRNEQGLAQPTVFAPVLGGQDSKMNPGDRFQFKMQLVVAQGVDTEVYESLARSVYNFKDYRNNALGPLNFALDNMMDYGMSEYSWFIDSLKGCAYSTDVPGAVKNVSSLNPLQMALLTDRQDIYEQRAYPIIEYLLSREKFLFSLDPDQKIQSPSRKMNGPAAPISELTSLYNIFGKQNEALLQLALEEFGKNKARNLDEIENGNRWQNALALYTATEDNAYLEKAVAAAKKYLISREKSMSKGFVDGHTGFFFWTGFTNDWINLLRLYEVSNEQIFLDAAQEGARHYAQFTWMSPRVPDTSFLVNKGGMAPAYWYLKSKGHIPMEASEELVPAWRLSAIGLTPESSGTCNGHRGIFMANYAPWMLRLAHYTGDQFLKDIARSAIVGRYTNFPGYHINTARTTVYEKPDYPIRPFKELSVNSFHFNHIWPHTSILLDYLVSDALYKSKGAVDFPGDFIEGYAYLQSNFYGHQAGKIYDIEEAWLWMPKHLLNSSSPQLNYLSARSSEGLVILFMNQSDEDIKTQIQLNRGVLDFPAGKPYELIMLHDNGRKEAGEMRDATFSLNVKANQLTAILIKDLQVEPSIDFSRNEKGVVWNTYYQEIDLGDTKAIMLDLTQNEKSLYSYSAEDDSKWRSFRYSYQLGDKRIQTRVDKNYPFELTIPFDTDVKQLRLKIEGTDLKGQVQQSEWYTFVAGMQ